MPVHGDMKFDKRIIERNLRVGLLTQQDYQNHLDSLKDLADECSMIESEMTALGHESLLHGIGEEDDEF